jgi:hypothetical protein
LEENLMLKTWCSAIIVAAFVLGCGNTSTEADPELGDELQESTDSVGQVESELTSLNFTEFSDPQGVGNAAQTATRVVINSAAGYQKRFGHAAPALVDFAAGDSVVFYSAGVQTTGGYTASIQRVATAAWGRILGVTTRLSSPGAGCMVTQALTTPYALAKFRRPASARWVFWLRSDVTRDCSEPEAPSCKTVKCSAGHHCELVQVQCVRAPCPPLPQCVADPVVPPPTGGTFCGGFARIACPSGEICVDNPNDGCDPKTGGADCGGICVTKTPPPSTGAFCGGIAGIACPSGQTCVDNPNDGCDPKTGGADCGGVCVTSAGETCGSTTCAKGTTCCNASCGVCVPPGGACTQQVCSSPN